MEIEMTLFFFKLLCIGAGIKIFLWAIKFFKNNADE